MQSQFANAGLFFLFILLSGFWLNRRGRPYSVLMVTVHKLIGLAAGIYLGLMVYRVHQASPLNATQIVAVLVTVLSFAVNVATGSLLSTNKPMPRAISVLNRFFPYLTIISTGITIYILS